MFFQRAPKTIEFPKRRLKQFHSPLEDSKCQMGARGATRTFVMRLPLDKGYKAEESPGLSVVHELLFSSTTDTQVA